MNSDDQTAKNVVNVSIENKVSQPQFRLQDYALILKPRVMSLVVFTAFVGLLLAPGSIDPKIGFISIVCIAIGAGASGAINMWYDQDIDLIMTRTMNRPIPAGRMDPKEALFFGVILSSLSVGVMAWFVNLAAAALLAITILYYVIIYTMWLKRRSPQNIVIGGVAGAFPPMIGWIAVTGTMDYGAIALFFIIFLWTPPHSWALALFRKTDYEAAGVPMMPLIVGELETKRLILIYSWLMVIATMSMVVLGISGLIYFVTAGILGSDFLRRVWLLWKEAGIKNAKPLFLYSIFYLFVLFVALIVDQLFFFKCEVLLSGLV